MALTAGEIRMYLVAEMDDSTWPDVFDGTESVETVTDTNVRDAVCRLAAITATDTTASQVYYLQCPSVAAVFGGTVPRKFVIFITQSTVSALETTGDPNQVYVAGVYENVGAGGDVKKVYVASAAQTQTNLDGLASSATHVAGWESAAIDNSSNLYLDYRITAKIQVESA